jgi:hypothetical protein
MECTAVHLTGKSCCFFYTQDTGSIPSLLYISMVSLSPWEQQHYQTDAETMAVIGAMMTVMIRQKHERSTPGITTNLLSRMAWVGKNGFIWRMPSSGMWCHVTLVRTDVSEERITSIIGAERISQLGTMLPVTSNLLVTSLSYKNLMASHPRRRYSL